LIPENFAVMLLDALCEEIFGHVIRRPSHNFGPTMYSLLFFVRLFTLDIRHSVVNSNAVLASRICSSSIDGTTGARRRLQSSDVLVDDVEGFAENFILSRKCGSSAQPGNGRAYATQARHRG
jgi:hypothetical protein